MIAALTLRGLEDGIRPKIRIAARRWNLTKDHDSGSDSERTHRRNLLGLVRDVLRVPILT